jgi:hypothetical protein
VSKNQEAVLFPTVAADSAGGLYAAWSGCDAHSNNSGVTMFAASTDGGRTWHSQRPLSDTTVDPVGDAPATVFPWVVAGNPGYVDVTFAAERQPVLNSFEGSDDGAAESSWDLHLAQSTNANSSHPAWKGAVLKSDFHTGSICSLGTGCVGPQGLLGAPNVPGPFDRRDLDFFGAALDGTGHLYVPYTADRPISPTDPVSVLIASVDLAEVRQVGGQTLGSSGH